MLARLHVPPTYIAVAAVVIIGMVASIVYSLNNQPEPRVTAVTERGIVTQSVSVSGIASADQTAELAFPVTGIVEAVSVGEGDQVEANDVLARLTTASLATDRQDALASLTQAVATRDELASGLTPTARDVSAQSVAQARETLATTRQVEAQNIDNAYQALLSNDLIAYTTDTDEESAVPTISGSYNCSKTGQYIIEMYRSGAPSGYSYRLSGLETETASAAVTQPMPLGTCGLKVQFDASSRYDRTTWYVDVPNKNSSTYVNVKNAYSLAQTKAASAITAAEEALALAEAQAANETAPARTESLTRANASINQAEARLARIDTQIADRVLRAPFSGTITNVSAVPGEAVSTNPVITLVSSSTFEVVARVPEIDVGKLDVGQSVSMVFDARSDEIVDGTITFVSLNSTIIDGVAYYEAFIDITETPDWMRSGLNADITITTAKAAEAVRVAKRFVDVSGEIPVVYVPTNGERTVTQPVTILLDGTDGYVALTGIEPGITVVAP